MEPNELNDRPDLFDPLEDALRRSRARAGPLATVTGRGEWRLRFPPPSGAKFNFVSEGACVVSMVGVEPAFLRAGDTFLLTRSEPFVIATSRDATERSASHLFAAHPGSRVEVGDARQPVSARLLGGSFTFVGPAQRLVLEALPPIVHVPAQSPHAAGIATRLAEMDREVRHAQFGAQTIAESLASVLLVELLRFAAISGLAGEGLLAGMRDEVTATALRALHGDPSAPWTVARLAQHAGVSRSTLAARFKAATGVSPLSYLTNWRLDLAAEQLMHTRRTLAAIAVDVGYGSETAFALAFKRERGISPGAYRRATSM